MKTLAVAALALLVASPAVAQPSNSGSGGQLGGNNVAVPEGPSEAGAGADGERRVCRRVETGSSSRMQTRRVCLTPAEWRERDRLN